MKKVPSLLLSLLAGLGVSFAAPALAQDTFEREFSKFDKDFERLNSWKAETPASRKLKRAPIAQPTTSASHGDAASGTTPLNDDAHASAVTKPVGDHPAETEDTVPAKAAKTSSLHQGLPKGAKVERLAHNERLGNQISDPVMRKKVQDLYKRSDVVVQQYVLPTN